LNSLKKKLGVAVLGILGASSLAFALSPSGSADWSKWRGPQGDGIVREGNLATQWPAAGPKKVWSAKVGGGHASPVVANGIVYLFTRDEEKNLEVLTAYQAADGKVVWQQESAGGYNAQSDPSWHGTRTTPSIDGHVIYTYGGSGDLIARELADGKEIWHLNVLQETKAKILEWGEASSPLVAGEMIYVQGGIGKGAPVAVAVNKADGKILWQSEAKGSDEGKNSMKGGTGGGYAAPILASVGGKNQLVVLGGVAVYGMDPTTGKKLWEEPWLTSYDVNATTPVYQEPKLFISTGYGRGCMMLELSGTGAKKLWENKTLSSKFPQVILDRGYLYGNSSGALKCLKWDDGKVAWELSRSKSEGLGEGGSLVRFGDYLILLGERGKLTLGKATPEGFTKISGVDKIVEGKNVWATPTIANGMLYVKGLEELVCLDISGK
jgi:outer membrane protein assembly factor BamB